MHTHNFTATYQEGIVSAVDSAKHKVRCKIPALEDLETAWLAYLAPNAGSNQFYCLPDEGELVAILLDAKGEGGCVLGTIYNTEDPTPVQDQNIWMKKFNNGTQISHNRKTGEVMVHTTGQVTVTAATAVVTAQTTINGNTTLNGNLSVLGEMDISGSIISGVDVVASGISLTGHTHTGDSGGSTGGPS